MDVNSCSNCAVCWKYLYNNSTTIFVSVCLFIFGLTRFSKNVGFWVQSAGNQRHISCLVGTSETKRADTSNNFFSWLAGLIDGDGTLLVSQKGYTSLEITMGIEDLHLLRYIQDQLGGSVKLRSGVNAYRYRLHNKPGMINLINGINGHIRHSGRLAQLHRVCVKLSIIPLMPAPLYTTSPWFAGFFDADGTIGFSFKGNLPQLSVRVTNKNNADVQPYKDIFGGNIYFDSSQNGYYQWSIQSRADVIRVTNCLSACRSRKSRRFFLLEEYYRLYDLRAFKADSIHDKAWAAFMSKWKFQVDDIVPFPMLMI